MKNAYLYVLLFSITLIACEQKENSLSEKDQFLDSLMTKLTLVEKIGQLNLPSVGEITTGQASNSDIAQKIREGKVGGLFNIKSAKSIMEVQKVAVEESSTKIPLIFAMDVIHGYKTVFPIPLASSCTWDMKMIEKTARIAAEEVSADGICWTFSPVLDLARDPRWGRIAEGGGEDPYLLSQIAKAMVNGYQGEDLSDNNTILSCIKHFALYGAAEAGRDYHTTDMSRLKMYNQYFPPYKAAVDAGAGSVMTSFNEIDGIPASGNKWLMDDVLRQEWGFDGLIVTDYTAINEMIDHGMGDLQTVSALALKAGIDMDMVGEGYLTTLEKSIQEGKISEEMVNKACRRILAAKYDLGLFDDPFKYCDLERVKTDIYTDEHREFAREVAAKSCVLLKNDKSILPLKKDSKIALIGPLGDNKENMCGTWSVSGMYDKAISLKEGMEGMLNEDGAIYYARGANFVEDPEYEARVSVFGKDTHRDPRSKETLIAEALETAKNADIIVAAVGEASEMSGESSSRSDIQIPEVQRELLKALKNTGKPIVMVLFTGRPLAIEWEKENIPAILNVWFGGSEAGYGIADVLFGDVNPAAKLTATFPRNVGQIPIYYSYKNTGRPLNGDWFTKFRSNYLDVPNTPLYPFGFGLSYTSFEYSDLKLDNDALAMDGEINVTVTIKNSGERSGEEVVQLYIRDLVGSITRPVKELKKFSKIYLEPNESQSVSFKLTKEDLAFYNSDLEWVAEPGDFKVFVGTNSEESLESSFVLK